MRNIRIEEVGDINVKYNYLEVFYKDTLNPFLDISITDKKELLFKFYSSQTDIYINQDDFEHILFTSKIFLPKAIKNAEDIDSSI